MRNELFMDAKIDESKDSKARQILFTGIAQDTQYFFFRNMPYFVRHTETISRLTIK
jgi:hypothetical protein